MAVPVAEDEPRGEGGDGYYGSKQLDSLSVHGFAIATAHERATYTDRGVSLAVDLRPTLGAALPPSTLLSYPTTNNLGRFMLAIVSCQESYSNTQGELAY